MCGICGKLSWTKCDRPDASLVTRMVFSLTHRGPDEWGVTECGPIVLGHARLKIIDLVGGQQPFANETGDLLAVVNGEIYNFQELRRELEAKGHRFASKSDCECVVHAYEEWGTSFVRRLRGMFALALWDDLRQELILARDRLGKKPLYYGSFGDNFLFASELKALLQEPSLKRDIDLEALHSYLKYGFVTGENSIFSGIKRLPPAHLMVIDRQGTKVERFWNRDLTKRKGKTEDLGAEMLAILEESVRLRLVSDVALGLFLSGGIDSTAVLALASRQSEGPLETFSVGFSESAFDELCYARETADFFGARNHGFVFEPRMVPELLPKLAWHFDEPFADSSSLAVYYLAGETKRHVTATLNGDGGDEALAGYERYVADRIARWYLRLPKTLRKTVQRQLTKFPTHFNSPNSILRSLKKLMSVPGGTDWERYSFWLTLFSDSDITELLSPDIHSSMRRERSDPFEESFSKRENIDWLQRLLIADYEVYLPDDLLVKMDRATMAHGLEARSPFLDHKFVEFTDSLPSELKLSGLNKKYLLKRILKGIVPSETLQRRKRGFSIPLGLWFKQELRSFAEDILLDPGAYYPAYFQRDKVAALLEEHYVGYRDNGSRIWVLLVFELWAKAFLGGSTDQVIDLTHLGVLSERPEHQKIYSSTVSP